MAAVPLVTDYVLMAIKDDNVLRVKHWVEDHPEHINSKCVDGTTLLNYAAIDGKEKVVNYLLEAGANPSIIDIYGVDTLGEVIMILRPGKREEIFLRIAAQLINHGGNVNGPPGKKYFPLHFAARSGSTKAIDLLVLHGADINAESSSGMTSFQVAAQNKKVEVLKQLKSFGVDMNAQSSNGDNAIHSAINKPEIVKLLISWGVKHDLPNKIEQTPLFLACRRRCKKSVRILLDAGVDTSYKNRFDKGKNEEFRYLTALEFCQFMKCEELTKMIEDYNVVDVKEPEIP